MDMFLEVPLSESFFGSSLIEPLCGGAGPNTVKEEYAVTEHRIYCRTDHFLLRTKVHSHHSNKYYSELLKVAAVMTYLNKQQPKRFCGW